MDFSAVTYWNLPEGKVKEVSRNGTKIWSDKIKLKSNGSVQFKGTKNATLPSATFYGKTEQTQLTGKNLLKIEGRTKYTKANITPTTSFDTQWLDKYIYKWTAAGYGRNDSDAGNVYSADEISFTQAQNWYGYGFAFAVKPNTSYTISYKSIEGNPAFGATYYNASGSIISYSSGVANTFKTPANTTHMVLAFAKRSGGADSVKVTKLQLEEGTVATSYEPYCGGMPSPNPQYPQEIKVNNSVWYKNGNNLYNKDDELLDTREKMISAKKPMPCKANLAVATVGGYVGSNNNCNTIVIPSKKGESYSIYKFGTITTSRQTYVETDSTGLVLKKGSYNFSSLNTITTENVNCAFLFIEWSLDQPDEAQIVVTRGSTVPTEYEPYYSVPAVDLSTIPLYGVNDAKNTYEAQTGKHVKKIQKIVLDGTQTPTLIGWRPFEGTSAWGYRQTLTNNKMFDSLVVGNLVSDRLQACTYISVYSGLIGVSLYYGTAYGIILRVPVEGLTTAAAINAYLAENPITVYYELAEPVTETLTPQPITQREGLNSFEQISGDIENTPIELEIYGKRIV